MRNVDHSRSSDGASYDPSRSYEAGLAGSSRRAGPRIQVRSSVVLAIGIVVVAGAWWMISERDHPAAAVARRIHRGDAAARIAVIHELEGLGRVDPEVALPALVAALGDPDPTVRAAAAMGLVTGIQGAGTEGSSYDEICKAVDALMGSLEDERVEVRAAVVQALWMIAITWSGPTGVIDRARVFDVLVDAAGDADAGIRLSALRGIGAIGPRDLATPPPVLVPALEDPSEKIRGAAVFALVRFRRGLPALVPELLRSLDSARSELRPQYREVLGAIQAPQFSDSAAAVPALMAILGSADAEARSRAARALATYKDKARAAVPALIQCLADARGTRPAGPQPSSQELMAVAVPASPSFLPAPRESAPASEDPLVEAAGTLALLAPGTPQAAEAVAALANLVNSDEAGLPHAAASALGRFGPDAAPAVPALARTLEHALARKDPAMVASMTVALGRIDAKSLDADRTIPILREALQDPRRRTPRDPADAADALGFFGPAAVDAVPDLIAILKERDNAPWHRAPAARALGRIAPGTPQAGPALSALIETLPAIREPPGQPGGADVLEALGRFGPRAAAAAPRLRELAGSQHAELGEAARKALAAIETAP